MRAPPEIQTERLVLRPMRAEDFPAYAAMMATDRARFMGGPFDERAAWGLFCHDAAGWSLFGAGALMIEAQGKIIGQTGFNSGPHFPEMELGWFLYGPFEGHGYATEAAAAMLSWAFEARTEESYVSYTDPANTASQAVAARLGGILDSEAPRQDPEDVVFRHRRPA
ncbi:MAG: GNAT family N-acetyltransferase [Pseudomonadota bacterium]